MTPLALRRRCSALLLGTAAAVAFAAPTAGYAAPGAPAARPAPGTPFAGARLWVDPHSLAAQHRDAAGTSPRDRAVLARIAQQPQADWFGDWLPTERVGQAVAARVLAARAAGAVPTLVVYDIPGRDCGQFSAGGAAGPAAYRAWLAAFAAGVRAGGPGRAAVILEPDALALLDVCGLRPAGQAQRLALLRGAVAALSAVPGVAVYLDAGSSGWNSPAETAQRLRAAGVAQARGFALNVAGFQPTPAVVGFGREVSRLLGGKPFVVDTSRNGLGAPAGGGVAAWCNPRGRALGRAPSTRTGDPLVDAYLWVKTVGESDGECGRGDPPSGQWFQVYAVGLAERATQAQERGGSSSVRPS